MANITITDLQDSIELDREALASVTGGHHRYHKCRRPRWHGCHWKGHHRGHHHGHHGHHKGHHRHRGHWGGWC